MIADDNILKQFQTTVWDYYHDNARDELPWRFAEPDGSFDPYKIMVSEFMLQQTQVGRVTLKYHEFLESFPTVQSLAKAELGDVLRVWSGLGYNRRAKFLHQAAQIISTEHNGIFPQTVADLVSLPGVGTNTAGAILAYAFNQPVVFVETNIRTIIIHHFFADQMKVPDAEILAIVFATLDREHPREWYWALMDYGSFLKQSIGNVSRQSKIYRKQSTFNGSKRQIRGAVLRLLAVQPLTMQQLVSALDDRRSPEVIEALLEEALIRKLPSQLLAL